MATIKVIPKKNFLLRVEESAEGKQKRVIAKRGEATDVTVEESKHFAKFFNFLNPKDAPVKKKGLTVK